MMSWITTRLNEYHNQRMPYSMLVSQNPIALRLHLTDYKLPQSVLSSIMTSHPRYLIILDFVASSVTGHFKFVTTQPITMLPLPFAPSLSFSTTKWITGELDSPVSYKPWPTISSITEGVNSDCREANLHEARGVQKKYRWSHEVRCENKMFGALIIVQDSVNCWILDTMWSRNLDQRRLKPRLCLYAGYLLSCPSESSQSLPSILKTHEATLPTQPLHKR